MRRRRSIRLVRTKRDIWMWMTCSLGHLMTWKTL